ncbi:MAG: hypothetical protein D6683_15840 [Actinomyces sp.]|nr:MAG: hypothetical protein D6683_15840 [Actinomyces sp.]
MFQAWVGGARVGRVDGRGRGSGRPAPGRGCRWGRQGHDPVAARTDPHRLSGGAEGPLVGELGLEGDLGPGGHEHVGCGLDGGVPDGSRQGSGGGVGGHEVDGSVGPPAHVDVGGDGRGEDPGAHGEGLEQDDALGLVGRHRHQTAGRAQQGGEGLVGDPAPQAHGVAEAEALDELLEVGAGGTVTGDLEYEVAPQLAHGLDDPVDLLVVVESPGRQQDGPPVGFGDDRSPA